MANKVVNLALELGATDAEVEINEAIDKSIEVLNGQIENFETSIEQSLALTVYLDYQKGSVCTSQLSMSNIDQIINKALDIAKYTQSDHANGLANREELCTTMGQELNLYNPIAISNQDLCTEVLEMENIALNSSVLITNSNGASISLGNYNFVIVNSHGFDMGYSTTRYGKSLGLIANAGQNKMQTDYWYSSSRDFNLLDNNMILAKEAVRRVLRRVSAGKVKEGMCPVIFEASIAKSLIGSFLGAISGNNLFRKLSFLNDSLNTEVFPNWFNIVEDPFINKGLGSCYFDDEGVKVAKRSIVQNGIVKGYVLSSYTARKLNMVTTGNAGGTHNIWVQPNFEGDLVSLGEVLQEGVIIIETIGHGLNMVTGDYSVGASGLLVENGVITYFVDNFTISGNLKEIFQKIKYVANDYICGSILCGSMLIDSLQISI
ncbi:MAG: metalloprotease PmbA [Bacteroidia bacterium]|nr:MAG: metalloprotease PmbA [Bacteroidia bacterium]